MNIDKFKAIFWRGFARPTLYRVFFPAMNGYSGDALNIMTDSLQWPGKQIKTTEHATGMLETKRPYAHGYEAMTITFILGNDWTAWNYIKDWQDMIVIASDTGRDHFVEYKNVYQRNITIEHLDATHNRLRRIELVNAFPTSLQSMELSNGSLNQVMRVVAVFDYDYWRTL